MIKIISQLILIVSFCCNCYIVYSNDVKLELKQGTNLSFPSGSQIIVFSKSGKSKEASEFPNSAFGDLQIFPKDQIGSDGKSMNKYPKTINSKKILFVYVLTPNEDLFYSSDLEGGPEFKEIQKGLIFTQQFEGNTDHILKFFEDEIAFSLKIRDQNKNLPDKTKLIVLTKSEELVEIRGYPNPENYENHDDEYINGSSTKLYSKTNISHTKYFIYALTPKGEIYFSSNRNGLPAFDRLVKGEMILNGVFSTQEYNQLSSYFPKQEDFTSRNLNLGKEVAAITLTVITVVILILFYYSRKITSNWKYLRFVLIGFLAAFSMGLLIGDKEFFQIQFPIAFSIVSLALGSYVAFWYQGSMLHKIHIVYSYFILGFAYSFFFYFVLNKAGLQGGTFRIFNEIFSVTMISIAVGTFVYFFTLSFLFMGREDQLVKKITICSTPFVISIIYSIVSDYNGIDNSLLKTQTSFIHYLFIVVLIVNTAGIFRLFEKKDYFSKLRKVFSIYLGAALNYFIIPAIISLGVYTKIETFLSHPERGNMHIKLAELFGVFSFAFHCVFLISYPSTLEFVAEELLNNNYRIATGIVWGFSSLLIVPSLGYTKFYLNENMEFD